MPLPPLGVFARPLVATSFESIATVGVYDNSSVYTLTFSSIPSTYKHLQIRGQTNNGSGTGTQYGLIQFNSDTGNNYSYHILEGNGSSASASATTSTSSIKISKQNDTTDIFSIPIVDILDYTNTNKYKTVRTLSGYEESAQGVQFISGLWQSTSAISTITIKLDTGKFGKYTQYALYGIKG